MITKTKKTLLRILFAAAVILLLVFIAVDNFFPGNKKDSLLTYEQADSIFRSVLSDYALNTDWYSKIGNAYKVRLPADVPAELIALDLSKKLSNLNASIISKEIVRGRSSLMEIKTGNHSLLKTKFEYDNSLIRNSPEISFILKNTESLNDQETSELINSSETFSMALVPSKSNRWLADSIFRSGKEYSLLINEDIDELNYRLDDKFSDKKLKLTIQTIAGNFPHTIYYLLDDVQNNYSQRVNSILKTQLAKMGFKYRRIDEIRHLDGDSLMGDILHTGKQGNPQLYIIDAADYLRLLGDFRNLRKRGFRIVSLSAAKGI